MPNPRERDYTGKYNASYEDIAHLIQRYSVRAQIDLLRFFRRLIVFAIVGNCDAHLKNFSLLERPEGMRLSPAYDIVNTALYPNYSQEFALSLNGKKRHLEDLNHAIFQQFGLNIGLPLPAIEQVFAEIRRGVKKADALLIPPSGETPEGFVHQYAEIVRNGCLRILEI